MELDDILEEIFNGDISIRSAASQYGYGRDYLKSQLLKKYPDYQEEINERLENNKKNSTTIYIDSQKLKNVFDRFLDGKLSSKEACKELEIKDEETLRHKFEEYIELSENPKLKSTYIEYMKNKRKDYSNVNFRTVAIYMIRNGYTQIEMAELLSDELDMPITSRAISREFEKLKFDEDKSLYDIVKRYSEMMRKHKINRNSKKDSNVVWDMIDKYDKEIEFYEQGNSELVENDYNPTSLTEERMRRNDVICQREKELREEGFSKKEISFILGVSVSTIRRAKLNKNFREEEK